MHFSRQIKTLSRKEEGRWVKGETFLVQRESSVGVKDTEGGECYERPKIITPKVAARPLNFVEAGEFAVKTMDTQKKFLDEKV